MVPRDQGYSVPPAWRHSGRYWLAWPSASGGWGEHLDDARDQMTELARLLADMRPTSILSNPEEVADISLKCGAGVAAMVLPHSSCCLRGIGPTFLVCRDSGGVAGIASPVPETDAQVAPNLLAHLGLSTFDGHLPLLGVMVDVDGEGSCLASESLREAATVDREMLERLLGDWLGVEKVLWLRTPSPDPLRGGHLFQYARFLAPGLVLVVADDTTNDAGAENLRRLRSWRDAQGRSLEVVVVPPPKRRERENGAALSMSYADLFMDGDVVIVPAFEDSRDELAYDKIVAALPDSTVISYPALEFAYGGSGLGTMILAEPARSQ